MLSSLPPPLLLSLLPTGSESTALLSPSLSYTESRVSTELTSAY